MRVNSNHQETYHRHFKDATNSLNNEEIAKCLIEHLGTNDCEIISDYLEQYVLASNMEEDDKQQRIDYGD
jgi:hypothetical protein